MRNLLQYSKAAPLSVSFVVRKLRQSSLRSSGLLYFLGLVIRKLLARAGHSKYELWLISLPAENQDIDRFIVKRYAYNDSKNIRCSTNISETYLSFAAFSTEVRPVKDESTMYIRPPGARCLHA